MKFSRTALLFFLFPGVAIVQAQVSPDNVQAQPTKVNLYVSATNGNDNWTGNLPNPNSTKTDGPLQSLHGARLGVQRVQQAYSTLPVKLKQVRVQFEAGGTYFLPLTEYFTAADSGVNGTQIIYDGYGGDGLYLDDYTGSVDVENNLVYRVSGHAISFSGPRPPVAAPSTVKNNIFAFARLSMVNAYDPYTFVPSPPLPPSTLFFTASNNLFYFDRQRDLVALFSRARRVRLCREHKWADSALYRLSEVAEQSLLPYDRHALRDGSESVSCSDARPRCR